MLNALSRVVKICICAVVITVMCPVSHAQAILAPPFGLQWGDTPDKILDWASNKELDVTMEMPGKAPELRMIRVESSSGPLPDHQAYAVETRYHHGRMFEVTVHYGAPGDDPERVAADFNKLKSALALKHGIFSPNNKQDKNEAGFIRRSVSYHVEPVRGLMLVLMLSELEDTLRGKRSARFSLLYRNENIIPK